MLQNNDVVSYSEIEINSAAQELFTQAPPSITDAQVLEIVMANYEPNQSLKHLPGERDRNYLLKSPNQGAWVLKIINESENSADTEVQIQVLDWLEQHAQHGVRVPQAIRTREGLTTCQYHGHTVRAYTFLEGRPVNQVAMTPALQYSFGQTAAKIVQALDGFEHPALKRVFLWDVMSLNHLKAWAEEIAENDAIGMFILGFFEHFNTSVLPKLKQLPFQVIHADLSQSNTVVHDNDDNRINGVLDFGDMTYAPRIVELGIATTYALDIEQQGVDASIEQVVSGFESELPLTEVEKSLLVDVIVARAIQRVVISQWRAKRFPDNAAYLLRGTAQALQILTALMPRYPLPQ